MPQLTCQRGGHPEGGEGDAHDGDLRVVPPSQVQPVRPRVHGAVPLSAEVAVSHRNPHSLGIRHIKSGKFKVGNRKIENLQLQILNVFGLS